MSMALLKVMVIFVALSPGKSRNGWRPSPRLDDVAYRETLPGLVEKMVEQFQFISVYWLNMLGNLNFINGC